MRRHRSLAIVLIIDTLLLGILPTLLLAHLLILKALPNLLGFTETTARIEAYTYRLLFPFEFFARSLLVTLPIPPLLAAIVIVSSLALWRGNARVRPRFLAVIAIPNILEVLAHVLNFVVALGLCRMDAGLELACLVPPLAFLLGRLLIALLIVGLNRKYVLSSDTLPQREPGI